MIPIHLEPEEFKKEFKKLENCCICRKKTRYWTDTDVACCPDCAKEFDPKNLPTKKEWFQKEARYQYFYGTNIN